MSSVGRNEPCPCGSGLKFKKCCLGRPQPRHDRLETAAWHLESGDLQAAATILQGILRDQPNSADALHLAGVVADRVGDAAGAIAQITRAITLDPRNARYHNTLGIVHGQRMRAEDAIACFRRALRLQPHFVPGLNNLAGALASVGEFDEAVRTYRRLIEVQPAAADVHINLANTLQSAGRLEEAERAYRQALTLAPLDWRASSGLLLNTLYQPSATAADMLDLARRLAEPQERALVGSRRPHANEPDPDRRLRIGYVSADLFRHSVAHFIEPILQAHDRAVVEVFCYATGAVRDAVTDRLERSVDCWVNARALSDTALADRVRSDRIDVLLDLSGHTTGHRLKVFARKPAPVQITWIGFLGTTGLSTMDYRFTDSIADGAGGGDEGFSERLVRLEGCCLCYRPPDAAPEVAALPAHSKGHITFGSFNLPAKHNAEVIKLWGALLRTVPDSRIMLKGRGLDRGGLRDATLAAFVAEGVPAERVALRPTVSDQVHHLQQYGEIDVALDPFPYNGVTTTCEALWMGVPVVALRGDRHSGRICASLLTHAGLADWVADTKAAYQAAAVESARDPRRLASLRSGMRERLRASRLMDSASAARAVEAAYRRLWMQWCRERTSLPRTASHPD